jgi:hypothetical protein
MHRPAGNAVCVSGEERLAITLEVLAHLLGPDTLVFKPAQGGGSLQQVCPPWLASHGQYRKNTHS